MADKQIPTTIDPTGTKEVGPLLNPFLNGLQPGDVCHWPDFARYRADWGVRTPMQTGITHEMNGARIVAPVDRPFGSWLITDGVVTNGTNLYSPSANFIAGMGGAFCLNPDDVEEAPAGFVKLTIATYLDAHHVRLSKPATNGSGKRVLISAQANRTRSLWDVVGGSELLWRNPGGVGANELGGVQGNYDYSLEAQHGMNLIGLRDFGVENPMFDRVHGDGLYIGGGGGGKLPLGYVRGGTLSNTGRMGIGLSGYEDLAVENVLITQVRRTSIDVEPNTPSNAIDRCLHLRVAGCIFGPHRLSVFSSGGQPNEVGLTELVGCCAKGTTLNMLLRGGNNAHRRGPYVITGCNSDTQYSTARHGLIDMEWMVGATVRDNSAPFRAGSGMYLLRVENSGTAPLDVGGNTTPGGSELLRVS